MEGLSNGDKGFVELPPQFAIESVLKLPVTFGLSAFCPGHMRVLDPVDFQSRYDHEFFQAVTFNQSVKLFFNKMKVFCEFVFDPVGQVLFDAAVEHHLVLDIHSLFPSFNIFFSKPTTESTRDIEQFKCVAYFHTYGPGVKRREY